MASARARVHRAALALSLVLTSAAAGGTARQKPDPPPSHKDTVVLRACVDGATMVEMPAEETGGAAGLAHTYRLTGQRDLVKQLKTQHDRHYEEVTGRVRGEFAPPRTGRRVGNVGSVGIVIGAGPSNGSPNAPHVPEMPAFEVKSFRHLEDRCPR